MGEPWLKKMRDDSKPETMSPGLADWADLALAGPKRFLRVWWYRCVKSHFYRCIAERKPESKIGRKHRAVQSQSRVHAEMAARVRPGDGSRDLIVFSVIDWHFRIQRPQHLCRRLAQMGYRVFYVETSIHDTPGLE